MVIIRMSCGYRGVRMGSATFRWDFTGGREAWCLAVGRRSEHFSQEISRLYDGGYEAPTRKKKDPPSKTEDGHPKSSRRPKRGAPARFFSTLAFRTAQAQSGEVYGAHRRYPRIPPSTYEDNRNERGGWSKGMNPPEAHYKDQKETSPPPRRPRTHPPETVQAHRQYQAHEARVDFKE